MPLPRKQVSRVCLNGCSWLPGAWLARGSRIKECRCIKNFAFIYDGPFWAHVFKSVLFSWLARPRLIKR